MVYKLKGDFEDIFMGPLIEIKHFSNSLCISFVYYGCSAVIIQLILISIKITLKILLFLNNIIHIYLKIVINLDLIFKYKSVFLSNLMNI